MLFGLMKDDTTACPGLDLPKEGVAPHAVLVSEVGRCSHGALPPATRNAVAGPAHQPTLSLDSLPVSSLAVPRAGLSPAVSGLTAQLEAAVLQHVLQQALVFAHTFQKDALAGIPC